jgi:hypothetical protein
MHNFISLYFSPVEGLYYVPPEGGLKIKFKVINLCDHGTFCSSIVGEKQTLQIIIEYQCSLFSLQSQTDCKKRYHYFVYLVYEASPSRCLYPYNGWCEILDELPEDWPSVIFFSVPM